jgi:hypothetical protein
MNNGTTVYTVIRGALDGEELVVMGTFQKYEDALAFRNADYKETHYIDDEDEYTGPDLNSKCLDDGDSFWSIDTNTLR